MEPLSRSPPPLQVTVARTDRNSQGNRCNREKDKERIAIGMLSLEGKQLGNYDVTRRIRVGGMGAVYEGRQRTAFDRRVAIKVILGDYASDRDMRRRFMREARTVARLHHPHILPLIEFGDEQGILYLVMPFIDGGTLTSYLRRSLPPLGEVAAIYQQLLDAV